MKKENEIRKFEEIKTLAVGCFDQMMDGARESVKYGFKVEESVPAIDYRIVEIDGVIYRMKMVIELEAKTF